MCILVPEKNRKGREKMKKTLICLLAVILTIAISIGATLAYLMDTDEDVNVMVLGNVKIDQLEYERVNVESVDEEAKVQEFHDNKPLYPAVPEGDFDYIPGESMLESEFDAPPPVEEEKKEDERKGKKK